MFCGSSSRAVGWYVIVVFPDHTHLRFGSDVKLNARNSDETLKTNSDETLKSPGQRFTNNLNAKKILGLRTS